MKLNIQDDKKEKPNYGTSLSSGQAFYTKMKVQKFKGKQWGGTAFLAN